MLLEKIKINVVGIPAPKIPHILNLRIMRGIIPGKQIDTLAVIHLNDIERYSAPLFTGIPHSVTEQLSIVATTVSVLKSRHAQIFLQQLISEYDVPVVDKENTLHHMYDLEYNADLKMMKVEAAPNGKITCSKCKDKNLVFTTSLLIYYLHQSFANAELRNRFITLLQRYQNLI